MAIPQQGRVPPLFSAVRPSRESSTARRPLGIGGGLLVILVAAACGSDQDAAAGPPDAAAAVPDAATLACDGGAAADTSCGLAPDGGTDEPACGNGLVDADEECDLGRFNGEECTTACTIAESDRLLWSLRVADAEIHALTADGAGGVVAAGQIQRLSSCDGPNDCADFWVQRFDRDGKQVWTTAAASDIARDGHENVLSAVALDADENIVVAGTSFTWRAGLATAGWVAKLDASGQNIWTNGLSQADGKQRRVRDLAISPQDGSIALVGSAPTPDGQDLWTHKLTPGGDDAWTQPSTLTQGLNAVAGATAFRDDGSLLVAGSWETETDVFGLWLGTLSSQGELEQAIDDFPLAISRWSAPAMAVGPHGDVVLLGDRETNDFPSRSALGLWFQKFDQAWTPVWAEPVALPEDLDLTAADVAIASDGSIVVAATLYTRVPSEDDIWRTRIWINRYDASGRPQWDEPFIRGHESQQFASTVTCDAEGDIYVAGYSYSEGALLMKLRR